MQRYKLIIEPPSNLRKTSFTTLHIHPSSSISNYYLTLRSLQGAWAFRSQLMHSVINTPKPPQFSNTIWKQTLLITHYYLACSVSFHLLMFFAIFADQRNQGTNCTPVGLKTFVPAFYSSTIEKYHFSSLSSHTVRIFLFVRAVPVGLMSLKFLLSFSFSTLH